MNKRITLALIAAVLVAVLAAPVFATGTVEEPDGPAMDESALLRTPDDPRLYEPGKLTVATGEPVFPPWMLDDDPAGGEGFENGIVYALAEELGFDREDVVWVRVTFDQGIAPGPKPYDFNIQQYSVTEARKEFVDFSMVYYQPDKAVVALPGSGFADATSFADLQDASWGATIGTTDLDYIENRIGAEDVAVFNDQVGTFSALVGGQIDATVISLPTALFATAVQVPEATIAAILPSDPNDLGFGLVFEKDNPIVDWINDGLEAIIARGVIEDLTNEYLVGDESIPIISD
jgi:polar amino acid transport system substrate-binding protein